MTGIFLSMCFRHVTMETTLVVTITTNKTYKMVLEPLVSHDLAICILKQVKLKTSG